MVYFAVKYFFDLWDIRQYERAIGSRWTAFSLALRPSDAPSFLALAFAASSLFLPLSS